MNARTNRASNRNSYELSSLPEEKAKYEMEIERETAGFAALFSF